MTAIIGTAGWTIPTRERDQFPAEGASLERYAARFRGVEINSSFHRPHRASTWTRWAESVPDDFRFAVKIPKTITHQKKLVDCAEPVQAFLGDVAPLGARLAIMLVQLPPSLAFDRGLAATFFADLARSAHCRIACEPRHPSWFAPEAEALLDRLEIARVAADPARVPDAAVPGGWRGLAYWRLHGSPVMYRSPYGAERLEPVAEAIEAQLASGGEAWCMFDNTASSEAMADALALERRLASAGRCPLPDEPSGIRSNSSS
jgi:uncharacterized protein YecE (DUF72 family)